MTVQNRLIETEEAKRLHKLTYTLNDWFNAQQWQLNDRVNAGLNCITESILVSVDPSEWEESKKHWIEHCGVIWDDLQRQLEAKRHGNPQA